MFRCDRGPRPFALEDSIGHVTIPGDWLARALARAGVLPLMEAERAVRDGRLVEHLTWPERHLSKRYRALVQGTATEPKLQRLRDGVDLDDGPARAAEARAIAPGHVELVLTEGRNRQVRRMLAAVGLPVV